MSVEAKLRVQSAASDNEAFPFDAPESDARGAGREQRELNFIFLLQVFKIQRKIHQFPSLFPHRVLERLLLQHYVDRAYRFFFFLVVIHSCFNLGSLWLLYWLIWLVGGRGVLGL